MTWVCGYTPGLKVKTNEGVRTYCFDCPRMPDVPCEWKTKDLIGVRSGCAVEIEDLAKFARRKS